MHLGTHLRSPSRMALRLLLLVALAAASITLTQCRMVGDRLTGVQSSPLASSSCLKACKDTYKADSKAEKERHKDLLRACNGNAACIAAENARYAAAAAEIEAAYAACKNACHDQGGGGQ